MATSSTISASPLVVTANHMAALVNDAPVKPMDWSMMSFRFITTVRFPTVTGPLLTRRSALSPGFEKAGSSLPKAIRSPQIGTEKEISRKEWSSKATSRPFPCSRESRRGSNLERSLREFRHPVREGHGRLEAQHVPGSPGRGEHVPDVAGSILPRQARPGGRWSECGTDRAGHVPDGVPLPAGHVERPSHIRRGLERQDVRPGPVWRVDEVADLRAVLEHAGRLAPLQSAPEDGGDTRIRRVPRHPRPIDIVIAKGDHRRAGLPAE